MVQLQWRRVLFSALLLLISSYICSCNSSVSICITNCVQCKQMFGHYFSGSACGNACILTEGRVTPDCNNPTTLRNFLKRLI